MSNFDSAAHPSASLSTSSAQTSRERAKQAEAQRLAAVREAYWQNSSENEFYRVHDALVSTLMDKAPQGPTDDQVKALFMILPAPIIGLGVAWGFGDTEVGDAIFRFIVDNKKAVAAQLGLSLPPEEA